MNMLCVCSIYTHDSQYNIFLFKTLLLKATCLADAGYGLLVR